MVAFVAPDVLFDPDGIIDLEAAYEVSPTVRIATTPIVSITYIWMIRVQLGVSTPVLRIWYRPE